MIYLASNCKEKTTKRVLGGFMVSCT